LASKQGAMDVEAVDIEEESFRNTVENCAANGVENVTARLGTLEDVQGAEFDGILANINRHVILASLPELASRSKPGAWLLVSGILLSDEVVVTEAAQKAGFALKEMKSRGNWLCGVFERGGSCLVVYLFICLFVYLFILWCLLLCFKKLCPLCFNKMCF
jgi:Ribosomal protein L11 methylase